MILLCSKHVEDSLIWRTVLGEGETNSCPFFLVPLSFFCPQITASIEKLTTYGRGRCESRPSLRSAHQTL